MDLKKKILSVDDSATIRKIIRSAVEVMKYELVEASDGEEAFSKLYAEEDIKLILLDWNMPGMNGYEFLKAAKSNNSFKSIPIMMVTTESEKENIIKAVKAGVANYLVKPFNTEELIKKIRQCIRED